MNHIRNGNGNFFIFSKGKINHLFPLFLSFSFFLSQKETKGEGDAQKSIATCH